MPAPTRLINPLLPNQVWVPVSQVSQIWNCHPSTIRNRIEGGDIPEIFVWIAKDNYWLIRAEYVLWPNRKAALLEAAQQHVDELIQSFGQS